MKYSKPPLTFEAQADLLLNRGLAANRDSLISKLKSVNYYRLSGYLYPFRRSDDTFVPDTSLETVWMRYTFDRYLRLLVMDAIERIEVAFRTQVIYHFAHTCGPFAYLDMRNFPGLNEDKYGKWLEELRLEIIRSREPFIEHFRTKYGDFHSDPPVWMLAEVMSFGKILTMFRHVSVETQKKIAFEYCVPDEVMKSWFLSINTIRNICAHHGRLWNRELGMKPKMPNPRKYPDWHHPVEVGNRRVFGILTIIWYLLQRIEPSSKWEHELNDLLSRHPDIPKKDMGFPEDWQECPIWKER
jgi:abortive infection bacteriophage resistance protein